MLRIELLTELRFVIDDTVAPYAWSDLRLTRWLADGEDKFCEQTGYFTDSTTYTLTTQGGVTQYALPSDRIIEVLEVWDGAHKLRQFTQLDRSQYYNATPLPWKHPNAWQVDQQTNYLTLLEPPLDGLVLTLRVHRRAAQRLDHKNGASYDVTAPSIPEQFHLGLVEYGAANAFGDHDRERQDPVKAKDHMDNFADYVRDGKRAFDRLNGASPRITPARQYVV